MTAPSPATHQVLVAELRDQPGALYRVVGVIRRHGHNIEQLSIVPSARPGYRRLTAVLAAADAERLTRQLARLVDVTSATASPLPRSESWPSSTTTQMPTYDV